MLIAFFALALAPQELTERDVKALVTEYVDLKDAKRKPDLVARLKGAKPILAQRTLKAMLVEGKAARVGNALELAAELRVPGLWSSARKYLESVDEDRVIRLGILSGEEAALSELCKRWSKVDVTSASFALLDEGLAKLPIYDIYTLDTFRVFLSANEQARQKSAEKILCAQLGISDPKELSAKYQEAKAEFARFGKPRAGSGQPALLLVEGGARRVGANYHVAGEAKAELKDLPPMCLTPGTVFRFQVYPVKPKFEMVFHVDVKGEKRHFKMQLDSEDWFMRFGNNTIRQVPAKFNEWNEFSYTLLPAPGEAAHPCKYHLKIDVSGQPFLPGGCVQGDWTHFSYFASGGDSYIGGVELEGPKK